MSAKRQRRMQVAPLTDREHEYIEILIAKIGGRRSIRVKQCWRNAQRLILVDHENRLRYCEGEVPVPHAWVTINGKVVDVTYEAVDRYLARRGIASNHRERGYFGAVVSRRAVLTHILRTTEFSRVYPLKTVISNLERQFATESICKRFGLPVGSTLRDVMRPVRRRTPYDGVG